MSATINKIQCECSEDHVNKCNSCHGEELMRVCMTGKLSELYGAITPGVNVNYIGEHHHSPLMVSCLLYRFDIALVLLQKGGDPNMTDKDGYSAMSYMTIGDKPDMLCKLIRFGGNVDTVGESGVTLLISAAYNNQFQVVCELIIHGADVTIRDKWGKRAIDYSICMNNKDISIMIGMTYNKVLFGCVKQLFTSSSLFCIICSKTFTDSCVVNIHKCYHVTHNICTLKLSSTTCPVCNKSLYNANLMMSISCT